MIGLLKKPLMKRGTGAVCALGIMLGAQVATFAYDSTDDGWKLGAACYSFLGSFGIEAVSWCLVEACSQYEGDHANVEGCIMGGSNEILNGPYGPH